MSFQPPQQPGQPNYGDQPQQPPVPGSYPPPPMPPQPQYAPPPPPMAPPTQQPQYAPPPPPAAPPGYPPQGYAPQSYPPPGYQAPGYGAAPTGGPAFSFNPAAVNPMDWGILAAGFLAFIFSFISYYTYSIQGFGSGSFSAWHGFFGWFAALVAVASAALVALELFMPQIKLPVPIRLASLIGWAVATLCVLLALAVVPDSVGGGISGAGFDSGHGFGYWASLVFIVAGLVLSFLRLKATGGKLPWEKGPSGPVAPGGYPQA